MDEFEKGNMSAVTRNGDKIFKSKPYNSETIKRFLMYMENFSLNLPKYLGETASEIQLSYVEGKSIHSDIDFISIANKRQMIQSAAKLLATFHLATEKFIVLEEDRYFLSYPGNLKIDVICHNDFAPYNVTFDGFEAIGIIDVDTICPGPREWDIAYALYRFILIDKSMENEYVSLIEQFLNAYGYNKQTDFFLIVLERLHALIQLFDEEIAKGSQAFITMEKEGHQQFYKEEVERIHHYWKNLASN